MGRLLAAIDWVLFGRGCEYKQEQAVQADQDLHADRHGGHFGSHDRDEHPLGEG
jgi:hypothetical protein